MIELTARHPNDGSDLVRAVISPRGASLRKLEIEGTEVIRSTLDPTPPMTAGVVLVPWPNRVAGGAWMYDGVPQQLAATEAGTTNAIHGLLAEHDYEVAAQGEAYVRLEAEILGAPGYPCDLLTAVEYAITPDGISVTHTITNRGDRPAPVALGAHPYLRVGDWDAADLTLTIAASDILPLDEFYFPTARRAVIGAAETLAHGRLVPEAIDHACLTGLTPTDGRFRHTLTAPDGQVVELWADQDFDYVQIYVTDSFPNSDSELAGAACTAIAIEPMTAPPNALQSGEGLRFLAPGETWAPQWGIGLR